MRVVRVRPTPLLLAFAVLTLAFAPGARPADAPPGVLPCFTNDVPNGYGTFLFLKSATFVQNPGADPVEASPSLASTLIELTSPSAFIVSNAIVTGPSNFRAPLTLLADGSSFFTNRYPSEAEMNAALPPGAWSTRFQAIVGASEPVVGFFPFTIASNLPPIPQVSNVQEAQAVNPGSAFTLQWVPWVGMSTNDRISVAVVTPTGQTAFSAATDCAGQVSLASGATSVEIPAGTLSPGTTYAAHVTFGGVLLSERDDSAVQIERGFQSRSTRFTLRTTGSGGGQPGNFTNIQVTVSNIVFTLQGAPGSTYLVQSTTNFTAWLDEVSVVMPPAGSTNITIALAPGSPPRFFRAITTASPQPGGDPASLVISQVGTNELAIVVTGSPGATYTLESTTNYVAWIELQDVVIPAGTNAVVVTVTPPAGAPLVVYRATSASGPPPSGDGPTLVLNRAATGFQLLVSGGAPQQAYVIQKTGGVTNAWANTTLTITTDATGAGSGTITPEAGENAAFYRAQAP